MRCEPTKVQSVSRDLTRLPYFLIIVKGLQIMKMQTLPIVPWIGGKRRLAKHIEAAAVSGA
ncbi:hypothetical protein EIMP300_64630 [Escherichia coli]|uniref:Uncharacterized protein n=1 Tax=Escherichia coli TaxID=562 RepID=A0A8S0FYN2_ECOLX|nr:hypothetical protein EIMP300_64630 [Escherichia coli]